MQVYALNNYCNHTFKQLEKKMMISYPIKLQCWLSNCNHTNKSVILSYKTGNAHKSPKRHYFPIKYGQKYYSRQGLFQQFWEKAPGQNWEKLTDITSKLGEIKDIEHYKGS